MKYVRGIFMKNVILNAEISRPIKQGLEYAVIKLRLEENSGEPFYYIEKINGNKVDVEKCLPGVITDVADAIVNSGYSRLHAFSDTYEFSVQGEDNNETALLDKKMLSGASQRGGYLIPPGTDCPIFRDMGIFDEDNNLVKEKMKKYKLLNRFLILADDTVSRMDKLNFDVLESGCSSSYLSLIFYYYFSCLRGYSIGFHSICSDEATANKLQRLAKKYHFRRMTFSVGSLVDYKGWESVGGSLIMAVQAVDTDVDKIIYNAIKNKAKGLFVVPHGYEQLRSEPDKIPLAVLSQDPKLRERFCEVATDAIRVSILEACSYETKMFDFLPLSGAPKPYLISAVKRAKSRDKDMLAFFNAEMFSKQFGFSQTLYHMLQSEL